MGWIVKKSRSRGKSESCDEFTFMAITTFSRRSILPNPLVLAAVSRVGLGQDVHSVCSFPVIGLIKYGHQFVAFGCEEDKRQHGAQAGAVDFGKIWQYIRNGFPAFIGIIGHLIEAVAVVIVDKIA